MSIFFRVASGTFLRMYVGLYVFFLLTDLIEQFCLHTYLLSLLEENPLEVTKNG